MKKSNKTMQKPLVNFGIPAIMSFCMSAIISTGFLIKYTLISEQERWGIYGENVELYFLGMSRYQWGTLHLILGFVLLALLVAYIIFHWKIIINVYKNNQRTRDKKNSGIGFNNAMYANDCHAIIYKTCNRID